MVREDIRQLYESLEGDAARLILEDDLTGIFNRRFLLSYLEREFGPVERGEEDAPPSLGLVMVDVDKFKQINDTYGHDAGDELIIRVAGLLREVARDHGLPVRWGGDEFILVLPGADRLTARETGEELCRRIRSEAITLSATGTTHRLTLSVGTASAPDDATDSDALSLAADAALYNSKRTGRDRVTSADEIDIAAAFPKAALHRLEVSGIVARERELETVAAALECVAEGQSRMILFEGRAGLGKTTLLSKIGESLSRQEAFSVLATSGSAEEESRPYYLAERIAALLRRAEQDAVPAPDQGFPAGAAVEGAPEASGDDVSTQPMVLLLDDLHLADAESLKMVGEVLDGEGPATLICAAAMAPPERQPEVEATAAEGDDAAQLATLALHEFLSRRAESASIERCVLAPLSADEMERYLLGAFPGLETSHEVGALLEEVTGGNPLFMAELIRMLITDEKIRLVGQAWTVEPLRKEDLPASLDEIVTRQIATLDDEDRHLLEQLSVLGESASFQSLVGTSQIDEARLLDFLDRAEDLGLLRVEQERNDWNLRFAGKSVQEVSYDAVDPDRRRDLHQRVVSYHEHLTGHGAGAPTVPVAHHQRRAAGPETAVAAEELPPPSPHEAGPLRGGSPTGVAEPADLYPGRPLDEAGLLHLPIFLRALIGSVRAVRLYPAGSQAITRVRDEVGRALGDILRTTERLKISGAEGFLLVNDRRVATSSFGAVAGSSLDLLKEAQLDGVAFDQGIGSDELQALLDGLAAQSATIPPGYWQQFRQDHGLRHLDLKQRSYTHSSSSTAAGSGSHAGGEAPGTLAAEALATIPEILRSFLGAVKSAGLYPSGSDRMGAAIASLEAALVQCLAIAPVICLERFGAALSVNGMRLDADEFRALEERFAALLKQVDVDRITFSAAVTSADLQAFVDAVREQPNAGGDPEYWARFSQAGGRSGLAVNDHRLLHDGQGHAGSVVDHAAGAAPAPVLAGAQSAAGSSEPPTEADGLTADPQGGAASGGEAVSQLAAAVGVQLGAERERRLFAESLGQLFSALGTESVPARTRAARQCLDVFEDRPIAEQYELVRSGKDALAAALGQEANVDVLRELIPAIRKCAEVAIRASDYRTAGDMYSAVAERLQSLDQLTDEESEALDDLLVADADPKLGKLLGAEIRSREPERISGVLDCMRHMGPAAVPALIDIVEQEIDLNVRQLAADVLAEADAEGDGAEQLRRALNWADGSAQRVRILEVIDSVTHDLREDLPKFLADRSSQVRKAAFELAERLDTPDLTDMMAPLLESDDPGIARSAARTLARLGSSAAAAALVRRLQSAADSDGIVVCCQALGEMRDPQATEALAQLLQARRWGFMGPRWSREVRVAAAGALRRIPGREAADALSSFATDRDPAVRQVAARGPITADLGASDADERRSVRRTKAAA